MIHGNPGTCELIDEYESNMPSKKYNSEITPIQTVKKNQKIKIKFHIQKIELRDISNKKPTMKND